MFVTFLAFRPSKKEKPPKQLVTSHFGGFIEVPGESIV